MQIDKTGHVVDHRVQQEIRPLLERGNMPVVNGIIVRQTDASTAQSSLDSYKTHPIGAHFLIDKDGTITRRRQSRSGSTMSANFGRDAWPSTVAPRRNRRQSPG